MKCYDWMAEETSTSEIYRVQLKSFIVMLHSVYDFSQQNDLKSLACFLFFDRINEAEIIAQTSRLNITENSQTRMWMITYVMPDWFYLDDAAVTLSHNEHFV